MLRTGLIIFMMLLTTIAFAQDQNVWRYPADAGYFDSSPVVTDVDADEMPDLVLATTAGRVLALDVHGRVIWWWDTEAVFACAPTALQNDAGTKIFVVSQSGKIFSLDGKDGRLLWQFQMDGKVNWGGTLLVAANLDGNDPPEILAGDTDGNLYCLSTTGKLHWRRQFPTAINTSPAVADLNRDGWPEILIGLAEEPLICLSNTGKKLWQFEAGKIEITRKSKVFGASPVVWDLNQDGSPEILVGCGTNLCAITSRGALLWKYPLSTHLHDGLAVGELDGSLKIVAVDLNGKVVCLDAAGKLCWEQKVKERVRRSPAMADIDGDGAVEVLIAGYDETLSVFSADGELKTSFWTRSSVNAAPTVVWWQRPIVITASQNEVAAFAWDFPGDGTKLILWPEYRFNACRNAAKFTASQQKVAEIAQVDFGNLYVGANGFKVNVKNPGAEKLNVKLEIYRNKKDLATEIFHFQEKEFAAELPYRIFGDGPASFEFRCLLKKNQQEIDRKVKIFEFTPFVREISDTQTLLAEIGRELSGLANAQQMRDRWRSLKSDFTTSREQTKQPLNPVQRRAVRDKLTQIREESRKIRAMLGERKRFQSELVAYAANPWAPFGGVWEIMERRTPAAEISIAAFSGEVESAAINLANFSDQTLMLRVEPENLVSGEQSLPATGVLNFHEVIDVPTQMSDFSADALPELGQAQTILLPGWSMRQLWIRVETGELAAGTWKSTLKIRALVPGQVEANVPVNLEVWPTVLPPESALNLCHWGYVYRSVLKDQPQAALEDKVAHGTSVFVATNYYAPEAEFNDQGEIVGEINFTRHDAFVTERVPHGQILFFNYQHSLKGPGKPLSPLWNKAHAEWLAAWIQHLKDLGIGYEKYALYPIDEPGLRDGLVEQYIEYSKLARAVDPQILIYNDPVAGATMSDLKKMAPYVNIWCPNRNGFLLHEGNEKLDFIKSTGSTVWTYECQGNAKHQSPLGYYRAQAWLAWHHGLTGIGFWSYCTSSSDPWYVPVGTNDYLLIYQGKGVVSSKRWEAIRDGVEDYNLLRLLQQKVVSGALKGKARAAQNLLKKEASTVAQFCGLDEDGTLPGVGGIAKRREIADHRWQKIQSVRRQLAELLQGEN